MAAQWSPLSVVIYAAISFQRIQRAESVGSATTPRHSVWPGGRPLDLSVQVPRAYRNTPPGLMLCVGSRIAASGVAERSATGACARSLLGWSAGCGAGFDSVGSAAAAAG